MGPKIHAYTWELAFLFSLCSSLLIALIVVLSGAIFNNDIRVTKISFEPYYYSIAQMVIGVLYVPLLLIKPEIMEQNSPFYSNWRLTWL